MDFNPTMNVIEPSVCVMCALSDYQRPSLVYGVTRKELGGSHAPHICTTSKDFHIRRPPLDKTNFRHISKTSGYSLAGFVGYNIVMQ